MGAQGCVSARGGVKPAGERTDPKKFTQDTTNSDAASL